MQFKSVITPHKFIYRRGQSQRIYVLVLFLYVFAKTVAQTTSPSAIQSSTQDDAHPSTVSTHIFTPNNRPSPTTQSNTLLSTSSRDQQSSTTQNNQPFSTTRSNQPSPTDQSNQRSSTTQSNPQLSTSSRDQQSSTTQSNQPSPTTQSNQPSSTTQSNPQLSTSLRDQQSSIKQSNQQSSTTQSNQASSTTQSNQPSLTTQSNQPSSTTQSNPQLSTSLRDQQSSTTQSNQASLTTQINQSSSTARKDQLSSIIHSNQQFPASWNTQIHSAFHSTQVIVPTSTLLDIQSHQDIRNTNTGPFLTITAELKSDISGHAVETLFPSSSNSILSSDSSNTMRKSTDGTSYEASSSVPNTAPTSSQTLFESHNNDISSKVIEENSSFTQNTMTSEWLQSSSSISSPVLEIAHSTQPTLPNSIQTSYRSHESYPNTINTGNLQSDYSTQSTTEEFPRHVSMSSSHVMMSDKDSITGTLIDINLFSTLQTLVTNTISPSKIDAQFSHEAESNTNNIVSTMSRIIYSETISSAENILVYDTDSTVVESDMSTTPSQPYSIDSNGPAESITDIRSTYIWPSSTEKSLNFHNSPLVTSSFADETPIQSPEISTVEDIEDIASTTHLDTSFYVTNTQLSSPFSYLIATDESTLSLSETPRPSSSSPSDFIDYLDTTTESMDIDSSSSAYYIISLPLSTASTLDTDLLPLTSQSIFSSSSSLTSHFPVTSYLPDGMQSSFTINGSSISETLFYDSSTTNGTRIMLTHISYTETETLLTPSPTTITTLFESSNVHSNETSLSSFDSSFLKIKPSSSGHETITLDVNSTHFPPNENYSITTEPTPIYNADKYILIRFDLEGNCTAICENTNSIQSLKNALNTILGEIINQTILKENAIFTDVECKPFSIAAKINKSIPGLKIQNIISYSNGNITITHNTKAMTIKVIKIEIIKPSKTPKSESYAMMNSVIIYIAVSICVVIVALFIAVFMREKCWKNNYMGLKFHLSRCQDTRTESVSLTGLPRSSSVHSEMKDNGSLSSQVNPSCGVYSTIELEHENGMTTSFMKSSDLRRSPRRFGKHRRSLTKKLRSSMNGHRCSQHNQKQNNLEVKETTMQNNRPYGLVIGVMGYNKPNNTDQQDIYAVPQKPQKKRKVYGLAIRPSNCVPKTPNSNEGVVNKNPSAQAPVPPRRYHKRYLKHGVATTDSSENLVPRKKEETNVDDDIERGVDNPSFGVYDSKSSLHI